MKNYKNILSLTFALLVFSGCSDDFLEEKRDLTGVNEEVFQDPAMATGYVDYVYGLFSPANNGRNLIWDLYGGFEFSKNTDELPGASALNKPYSHVSFTQDHALGYFGSRMTGSIQNNTWTRMRQINLFLENIDEGGLPEQMINELKGQMYFWRAWQYWDLVKIYGGVPIVLTAQNPIQGDPTETQVPRSSTEECINQIMADLDMAMELLPGKWGSADWGRITSGAAAAFKSRVLIAWASPLFNRDDDVSRWQLAYAAAKDARAELESNGFGLFNAGNLENGEAWEKMWLQSVDNPEAVMIYGFNNLTSDQTRKNNGWERACRPREINGGGQISPTKQMLDAFPMADGKMPGESEVFEYDPNKFYKNRDPRFYKTFVFNGARWPYRQDPGYRLWNYRWAKSEGESSNVLQSTEQNPNSSGIYMRKATDPNASNEDDFVLSGLDVMEIRFAEVVLDLAEAAIGIGSIQEGLNAIIEIRERAGVQNLDGRFGVDAGLDRDKAFAAVLNERRVEFAYEGRRYWDLRRWLLLDDTYGTTSRLGMEPINGMRRQGIFVLVNPQMYIGGDDPMIGSEDEEAILADRTPENYPEGISTEEEYLDYLYDNYFQVVVKDDLDPTDNNWVFSWYPEYYFSGLNQEVLESSPYLGQTKGWDSMSGQGTFDPLAN